MARSTKPVKKAAKKSADRVPWKGGSKPVAKAKEKAPPADVTAMVEKLAKANAAKRKAQAALDAASEVESGIRADLVALFGKKKIDGFKHKLGTVSIYKTSFAQVDDMEKLLKYAKLKGNADLLTVGVSTTAVKARWDDGKVVPGVKKGEREDLRFTPAKKK